MKPPAIRCFGLTKRYGTVDAAYDVELTLYHGELLVLLGPSACGKTTLLRLLAGFEHPDRGTLAVEGRILSGPGVFEAPENRNIGMVAQDYALFPHMNVVGNVAYGLARKTDRASRVKEVLNLVGLDELGQRMPHELSGGEQQRVALARALAPKPDVVLLDEPFSNLDMGLRSHLRAELRWILKKAKATAIFVTHDQEDAMYLGDRVAVMQHGRLRQVDVPERIYHHPSTRFVAEFVGQANFLQAKTEGDALITELGALPAPADLPAGNSLEVMIRPIGIVMHADTGGEGRVVDKVFQGSHYLYSVLLPSGTELKSLRPHSEQYSLGAAVQVRLDPRQGFACFVNGQLHPALP